jgi:hypothetical protein
MWSADILSASALSALSPLKDKRGAKQNASLLIFFALRAQTDKDVRALSLSPSFPS